MGRRGIRWKRKERGQRTEGRAEEEDDGRERERHFSTDFSRAGIFQRAVLYCTVMGKGGAWGGEGGEEEETEEEDGRGELEENGEEERNGEAFSKRFNRA